MYFQKREDKFNRIKEILEELYGKEGAKECYSIIELNAGEFLESRTEEQRKESEKFNPENPYEELKGKIFAIAYPDNVYTDNEYPLVTLKNTLNKWFPSIKGIHILPERTMSHSEVWPQDFFSFTTIDLSVKIFHALQNEGILDKNRLVTDRFEELIDSFIEKDLQAIVQENKASIGKKIKAVLRGVRNSHFNDGGFSQKTRAEVDPRFGLNTHLEDITKEYSTMLDFVVNHLDVDNDYLEQFRRGNNDGEAFLIIYRDRYKQLQGDRILEKTFRPRPFPLFTGMRKYPLEELDGTLSTPEKYTTEMNRIFTANGLEPLDPRLIRFMSIYFKVENDQGLTAEDKRIFRDFDTYTEEKGIDTAPFWQDSLIQARQRVFNKNHIPHMEAFMEKLSFDPAYADIFMNDGDHVFGREFYVYTTFSESQADVNPLSIEGFRMIIEDLFHLLASGSLTMMRMDAIKYLWKEIGKKNFDMEEGNRLIEVIRLLMSAVSPATLPLDEINSPDPVVYQMARDGGFAYLFGQVNAVPTAFNEGSLEPLIRFNRTKNEKCPSNLLPFVMLSTHDGRSVQGLGVQRTDGHVTIKQFYHLKDIVESRGGKPKFRSVTPGEIPGDTFRKVFTEAGYDGSIEKLTGLFDSEVLKKEDICRLREQPVEESDLLEELALRLGQDVRTLAGSPAIDYFIQWIVYGRTAYELCCTTRSAFSQNDGAGNSLTEEEEALRLVVAQLFVLTQGQDVPAIYFNDLIGLENDNLSYSLSGRPRDLNRHKNRLEEMENLIKKDDFTGIYVKKLNEILSLRAEDEAFYPGSENFRFTALGDKVFLNHPWAQNNHSFILGNIENQENTIVLKSSDLEPFTGDKLKDKFTGNIYRLEDGVYKIQLKPYGYMWLT
jgi:hypothetical protein